MFHKDNTTTISSKVSKFVPDLGELWSYRELFYIFCWRDIKIRYKQTLIGILWVIIQPLVVTGIFSVLFGKIARMPSDGIPYPLFVMTGLLFWNLFSNGLSSSSQSLVAYENMIKKVYFPRIIIPISSMLIHLVDFFIILTVLLVAYIYNGYYPTLLLFPVLILSLLITLLSGGGIGLLFSALNIRYRDARYILPFMIQIGLYLTPVIYPLSAIYDFRKTILMLNPLTGVIEASRSALSGVGTVPIDLLLISAFAGLIVFYFGVVVFTRTEKYFADLV